MELQEVMVLAVHQVQAAQVGQVVLQELEGLLVLQVHQAQMVRVVHQAQMEVQVHQG